MSVWGVNKNLSACVCVCQVSDWRGGLLSDITTEFSGLRWVTSRSRSSASSWHHPLKKVSLGAHTIWRMDWWTMKTSDSVDSVGEMVQDCCQGLHNVRGQRSEVCDLWWTHLLWLHTLTDHRRQQWTGHLCVSWWEKLMCEEPRNQGKPPCG